MASCFTQGWGEGFTGRGARGEGVRTKKQAFRLTPLFTVLLLAYPALQARYALAEQTPANTPQTNTLPELGRPNDSPATLSPNPKGITLDNRSDGKRLVVSPEYSDQTGLSLGGIFAFPLGDSAAGGLLLTAGNQKKELLFNAGFQMGEAQRLVLTLGQQRQHLDIGFLSGPEKTAMTQNSGAASYQFRLEQGLFNSAEINGYLAVTPSRDLADKSYAVDTAALYELWNDPRRVAGGRVTGLQGRLAFAPLPGATFKLGAGGERQEYDYLTGKQSTTRATGSAEWVQCLAGGYRIKAGADAAVQNRYSLGLERSMDGGGLFGASFTGIRGKNGAPNDNQLKLTWSYTFDSKRAAPNRCGNAAQAWGNLLDQVAQRPGFMPAQVVAKLDTTAAPVRQIAIDKTALPAGASVNTVTGAVITPLGIVATGIAGVTLNAAPFANTGQFALSGNSLVIDPGQIIQPAVGVTDTYVVTVNNFGGGTTLVTVVVSRGSVRIDSITLSSGDTTAPVTSSAPAISVAATDTTASVTQTINENGTGYYLVQAAAAAAPNVAAVMAGTSFAMTAGVPAAVSLTGLTQSTAYKYYFVAKDSANNAQAAVSAGLAITTTATADTTAPTTTAGPSVSGTTDIATTLSVTLNENGTGYYLVQAFAAAAPSVAAVQAGTSFAMTANVAATPAIGGLTASTAYKIYFVAKDAANNVQAAVQSVAVTTNTAPTANNFTYGTNIDSTAKTFDWKVLSAAADADGDPLTAAVQAQGAKGSFVVAGNNVTYTANANQTGSDSGTLRISDGRGGTKDITVTVNGIDTTPPATPATLTRTGNAGALAGYTNTQNISIAVADVADPSGVLWFVSESSSAPAVGDGGWSSTKPTSFTLSAGEGTKNIYVYVKDGVDNVQATGKTTSILLDATAPTVSVLPDWTGGVGSGSTTSKTITFADTAGGSPQTITITANNGGAIANIIPNAFGGAVSFDFVAPAGPVTSTITYTVIDRANNTTVTTQDVTVNP